MSKLKVGDWVYLEYEKVVGRIVGTDWTSFHVYTGKCINYLFLMSKVDDELTKLPIKFKGFEIKTFRNGVSSVHEQRVFGKLEGSYTRLSRYSYIFSTTPKQGGYEAKWWESYGKDKLAKDFPTIEQAKDWLELQYAIMLAKARGLV